jgi:hypothetical protein
MRMEIILPSGCSSGYFQVKLPVGVIALICMTLGPVTHDFLGAQQKASKVLYENEP